MRELLTGGEYGELAVGFSADLFPTEANNTLRHPNLEHSTLNHPQGQESRRASGLERRVTNFNVCLKN